MVGELTMILRVSMRVTMRETLRMTLRMTLRETLRVIQMLGLGQKLRIRRLVAGIRPVAFC